MVHAVGARIIRCGYAALLPKLSVRAVPNLYRARYPTVARLSKKRRVDTAIRQQGQGWPSADIVDGTEALDVLGQELMPKSKKTEEQGFHQMIKRGAIKELNLDRAARQKVSAHCQGIPGIMERNLDLLIAPRRPSIFPRSPCQHQRHVHRVGNREPR